MSTNKLINKIKSKILELTTEEYNLMDPRVRRDDAGEKPKIILGLSGGPDSTFLFHVLKELHNENKITLVAAHLNHGWREEAIIDETFCKDLCMQNNIKIEIANGAEFAHIKPNGSKEELGRKLRRCFLKQVLEKNSAQYIALAHHRQDQQETFFWRIIRGTTLRGLTCMKETEGFYIRPLLNAGKNEILTYLKENNLEFIEDKSNYSQDFLRNRIRKHVIPSLNECDDRFEKKLEDTIKILQEEDTFLENITTEHFEKIFKMDDGANKNNVLVGDLNNFRALAPVLQKRLIIRWLCTEKVKFQISSNFLNEILKFLNSKEGGSHQIHQNWHIIKKQKSFWIKNPNLN